MKKILFVSYHHQRGSGNFTASDFTEFNTEVRAELEAGKVTFYGLMKIQKYIEAHNNLTNVAILSFQWLDG